ncbi:RHTO0S07e02014g1_1 [Rhodotorula toruloides]|uniref:RHTO0S07e02014g1_1 n=2 Tax=Rhodotorula toruloides TaxID=5286 RepID=A0A061B6T2_RHOTO|nr:RHTO0S07e02014g1_1 [Rhodotorula toruloides]
MALSILAPLSYIGFLVSSLWLFSKIYRRRQANKPAVEPWFPHHKSRDIYVSLLSLDPPPPRPILVAALLRRAMDDVKLIWSIRDAKTSLTTLLQRGQIGDDLWERFLLAEKELEAEIVEVVGEANTFEPGYGQKIFNIASDMVSHERWKEVYKDINKKREEENAKLASGLPPSAVLAPNSYLTPSSLTLAPSNPLLAAGTTPAPSAASTLVATSSPAPSSPAQAPIEKTDVTSAPPCRDATPASAPVIADAGEAGALAGKGTPAKSKQPVNGSEEAEDEQVNGAASPADTPAVAAGAPKTTPKPAPNKKKGRRKPPVKGGR